MRKIFLIISCILITAVSAHAQKYTKEVTAKYNEAAALADQQNFADALPLFTELQTLHPENANLCYYKGICMLMTFKDINQVIELLKSAVQAATSSTKADLKSGKAPVYVYYYLGMAYFRNSQIADARINYNLFKNAVKDKNWQKVTDRCLAQCDVAEKMILNPLDIKVENLGSQINTEYPEYSPVMSFDRKTLIFTSRRPDSEGGKKDKYGKYYEDLYITTRECDTCAWGNVKRMGNNINTVQHDASIGISIDGKQLLIYRDEKGNGNIYVSNFENGEWRKPAKMSKNINTKSWETHACFSPDGNTLYFVSNKKGGYGARDIYYSKKDSKGRWGKAANLGADINTAGDEEAPFMLSDGQTLYFASNGRETMGGFDIFKTRLQPDGKWSAPENIGYPVNTTGNDVFYFPADELHAFYSSEKNGGYGDQDIYMITIKGRKEVIAEFKLVVVDSATNKPLAANAELTDSLNNVLSTYTTASDSGLTRMTLPFEKNLVLKVWAPQYKTWSEKLYIEKKVENISGIKNVFLVKLPMPVENLRTVQPVIRKFNIVFFDYDKNILRPVSESELGKVSDFLKKYPGCNIEISGHTCTMGSHEYNQKLSEKRARTVYDYMIANKIDPKRLTYKGYSYDQPLTSNDNEEGRMKNRRTEFRINCSNLPDSISIEIAKIYPADAGFLASPRSGAVNSVVSGYTSESVQGYDFSNEDPKAFTVQVGAGRLMKKSYFTARIGSVNVVKCSDGLKRFFTGSFATESEAKAFRDQIAGKGFGDAFVRPFSELISLSK